MDPGRLPEELQSEGRRRVVRGKVLVAEERPGTGDSAPAAKDARPLWLQHDARPIARGEAPAERRADVEAPPAEDVRKVKRLQQEIQRLSQRLAESEIYSAGAPRAWLAGSSKGFKGDGEGFGV